MLLLLRKVGAADDGDDAVAGRVFAAVVGRITLGPLYPRFKTLTVAAAVEGA